MANASISDPNTGQGGNLIELHIAIVKRLCGTIDIFLV